MREILFRGKRLYICDWVEGTGIFNDGTNTWISFNEPNKPIDFGMKHQTVYTETVGQFTGLTDKNGKKIFEGDIVDCWSEGVNAKGTVQQRKDGLWIIYPAWQKTIMWGLCPDEYCNTTVEVIGNIHDNPELVEVEDENKI